MGEKPVDRRHDLGAFADRAADALGRSGSGVADCEYARDRGFERRGRAALAFAETRAGDDEASLVDRDPAALEPFGGRIGADEEKNMADRRLRLGARTTIPPADPLEPVFGAPLRATISVMVISSIFGAAAMRSMRYRDMLSARPGPRTIMRTFMA